VFQASQAGQRPSQRVDSCPQAEQKKSVRAFAMLVSNRSGDEPRVPDALTRDRR
jgi:hypothetical protein